MGYDDTRYIYYNAPLKTSDKNIEIIIKSNGLQNFHTPGDNGK